MIDFEPIEAQLSSALTYEHLRQPMRALVAAVGMERYAVLRLRGQDFERLVQLIHNAPDSHVERCNTAAYWRRSPLVDRMVRGGPPVFYGGNVEWPAPSDVPGFEHGVGACAQEERGTCILFMARSKPLIDAAQQVPLMSVAMVAAARLLGSLVRLHKAACPLSERQLDCLRYSLAGFTSAETGRALGLSARTVEEYLTRARDHLSVPNSLVAAVRSVDEGWIRATEVSALIAA